MKWLSLAFVLGGALFAEAADEENASHRNFLAEAGIRYGQEAPPLSSNYSTVILEPFTVSGDDETPAVRKLLSYMEFGQYEHIDLRQADISYVPESDDLTRYGVESTERFYVSQPLALKLSGANELFRNGDIYFKGGLFKKGGRHWSYGATWWHRGPRIVIRSDWPTRNYH